MGRLNRSGRPRGFTGKLYNRPHPLPTWCPPVVPPKPEQLACTTPGCGGTLVAAPHAEWPDCHVCPKCGYMVGRSGLE